MYQRLDTSSVVHFRSTPLFIPANLIGLDSPNRSVPQLLIAAPLGGLLISFLLFFICIRDVLRS